MHFFDEPKLPRPDGLADGASISREHLDGDGVGDPRGNHGPAEGVAVMQTRVDGRVWAFGDDISTDHIIAGKYLGTTDPKVFAEHAFEAVDPTWAKKVQPGDMIVAGANFGCGSSREQAPVALKTLGISAILANSFARIFFRNAINLGFPVIECAGLREAVKVLKAVESAYGVSFDLVPFPCGGQHYLETGEEWPDGAFESCKAADAILLGAVGLPEAVLPNGDIAGVGVVFGLRFGLDLYANVRPTKLYPNVRHKIHDGFKLVWEPGKGDFVIVRENTEGLYTPTPGFLARGAVQSKLCGDTGRDPAGVVQGGMGMAGGGNIGDQRAMFEPIHGSAPKHAGKDEVNPIAMILAVQMMLDWLGRKKGDESMREAATAIEQAVETTLKKGTVLTYDLGGSAKCSEVGAAIASAVARPRKKS